MKVSISSHLYIIFTRLYISINRSFKLLHKIQEPCQELIRHENKNFTNW